MPRWVWTFIIFLLIGIACASAIPRTDLPETVYNEVDTPVNQAPPVILGIRFVRPARTTVVLPRNILQAEWNFRGSAIELVATSVLVRNEFHPLQDRLCTFLI